MDSISPGRIGNGGGAITILGDGFAADAFSQFDASKGNKVHIFHRLWRIFKSDYYLLTLSLKVYVDSISLFQSVQNNAMYKVTYMAL